MGQLLGNSVSILQFFSLSFTIFHGTNKRCQNGSINRFQHFFFLFVYDLLLFMLSLLLNSKIFFLYCLILMFSAVVTGQMFWVSSCPWLEQIGHIQVLHICFQPLRFAFRFQDFIVLSYSTCKNCDRFGFTPSDRSVALSLLLGTHKVE